jgi:hypothetical protein
MGYAALTHPTEVLYLIAPSYLSGLTHPKPETGFFGKYIFTKPTIFRKNPVSLRKS